MPVSMCWHSFARIDTFAHCKSNDGKNCLHLNINQGSNTKLYQSYSSLPCALSLKKECQFHLTDETIEIIIFVKSQLLSKCLFNSLCDKKRSTNKVVVLHTKVWWLSQESTCTIVWYVNSISHFFHGTWSSKKRGNSRESRSIRRGIKEEKIGKI